MQDFNDSNSFYLTNYLFTHFDYPSLSGSSTNQSCTSMPNSVSSSSSSSVSTAATASAVSATYKSNNYLTKIFRSYSNIDAQSTAPFYGMRDLNSVVNYHKELGIAPILSFFKKYAFVYFFSQRICTVLILF